MKRKDTLAAGARSATFAGGVGETDYGRNLSSEPKDDTVPVVEPVKIARKKFIPNTGVLLIRRAEAPEISTHIITSEMEKEQPSEGTVLAVSFETVTKSGYDVGAHVVFGKYAGTQFKLNGEILLLMGAEDIKGILVDDEPALAMSGVCIPGIARA